MLFIMQVLKPKIRSKILRVSEKHFFLYGFKDASMRKIAKDVGVSVSNLYRYYQNKLEMFIAVIDEYQKDFISNYLNILTPKDEEFTPYLVTRISDVVFEAVKTDRRKFIILMEKCEGTPYAEFKNKIVSGLEDNIRLAVKDFYKEEFIIRVIAQNFIDGLLEISNYCKDDDSLYLNLKALVSYHMKGILEFYK